MTYTFLTVFHFKDMASKKAFLHFSKSKHGISLTRDYQGCQSINLYDSNLDSLKVIIIQKWDSKKNKKAYLEMRAKEGTHDYFNTLVSTPMELELLTPIAMNDVGSNL